MKTARSLNVRKHGRSGLPDTAESGPVNPHRHLMSGRLPRCIRPVSPFLWGITGERRARRDAQRIENGMKRAVMLLNVRNTGKSGRGRHCFTRKYKETSGRSLASYQKNRSVIAQV